MAGNGDDNRVVSGKDEANCSETTVEIKIKTLDSQTYTLRVDKCVPVPALKEQIAVVTGVLSEQQRLICRGKVLKDDQLLSAYHVEDGHTLHLVVRQPVVPSSEGSPNPATDPASTGGRSQGSRGPGVVVGSFNISEQDGSFPDLSRVFSALLGSFGIAGVGSGSEGIDLNEHPLERILNSPSLGGLRNSSRPQTDQADSRGQAINDSGSFSVPTADSVESLQPPIIPDSLATLSQNLNRLRQEFVANVQEQTNVSQAVGIRGRDGQNSDAASVSTVQRGLPTPASLADVMLTARQILNEQVEECLLLLARQLEDHANVTDASERVRIQSSALRSGILLQNLGAVLLELARTTMTLRMGQTPAEAIVNAGPAVFLSPSGPNPIMVQPLSFQLGTGFGATGGTVQQSSGIPAGSGGSGVFPRNIDIRIRTVAVPASANRRESNGAQNHGSTVPAAINTGNSAQQGTGRGSGSPATRDPEVRVVPIRTVVAAVPASGGRATSDPSRGTMGMILPIFARVQRVTSGISGGARGDLASDQPHTHPVEQGSQSIPNSALQHENVHVVGVDGDSSSVGEAAEGPGYPSQFMSRLEQLLRGVFASDHLQDDSGNSQVRDADGVTRHVGAAENGNRPDAAEAAASDEGAFLSNVLRQIMPIIYENGGGSGSNDSSSGGQTTEERNTQGSSTQGEGNGNRASSSRRQEDPPAAEQPDPKRQKRD
ncbi:ubiquitin-like domain-containing protein CIP73 [Coffea arabica]|uniref:Ubiquitin-like domain-containing protein CIP73 n=1 Tax=Coffea arabica TaxID=13443 RepID=A0A6P6TXE9_COFAR